MSVDMLRGRNRWAVVGSPAEKPRADPAAVPKTERIPVVVADEWTLLRDGVAAVCRMTDRFRVVGHCGDGREAVRLIASLRPRIVLVEMELPSLPGMEVVRQARAAGSAAKFLCVSTQCDRMTVLGALRCGASGLLLKTDPAAQMLVAFNRLLAGIVYLSPQVELTEAFAPRRIRPPGDPFEALSRREYQVFSLLVEGVRSKEIAARLGLSPKTVDTYRSSLMRKLEIDHLAGLVKFAVENKLTPSG